MESTSGKITVYGLTHTNDDLRLRGDTKTFHGPVEYVAPSTSAVAEPSSTRAGPDTDQAIPDQIRDRRLPARRPGRRGRGRVPRSVRVVRAQRLLARRRLDARERRLLRELRDQDQRQPDRRHHHARRRRRHHGQRHGANFDPYTDGLLFLSGSSSTSAIRIDASKSKFLGYSFSERGQIVLTGAGDSFYCGVLADRIDISAKDLLVRGSGCTNPARTTAPTSLVPSLGVTLGDPSDALPGQALFHTATVTNDGTTLLVPGIIGRRTWGPCR